MQIFPKWLGWVKYITLASIQVKFLLTDKKKCSLHSSTFLTLLLGRSQVALPQAKLPPLRQCVRRLFDNVHTHADCLHWIYIYIYFYNRQLFPVYQFHLNIYLYCLFCTKNCNYFETCLCVFNIASLFSSKLNHSTDLKIDTCVHE